MNRESLAGLGGPWALDRDRIDIGRPSQAVPVTPPCIRVRTRRFGWFDSLPSTVEAAPVR